MKQNNNLKNFNLFLKVLFIIFLIIFYSYFLSIDNILDEYVIFEGETINVNSSFGLSLNESTKTNDSGVLELSLFDIFSIKDISVSVLPTTTVIPCGDIAGLKLYTDGILVVGMSTVQGIDLVNYAPYENSGIVEGDSITKVNDILVTSTNDFISLINNSNGTSLKITYIHDNDTKECSITPIKTSNEEYKVGLWVRDSAAGVGTITFYEPSTQNFGALRSWYY